MEREGEKKENGREEKRGHRGLVSPVHHYFIVSRLQNDRLSRIIPRSHFIKVKRGRDHTLSVKILKISEKYIHSYEDPHTNGCIFNYEL